MKWVGYADDAKRISLLLARMQQLRSDEEASLATLPRDLQRIVVSRAPGRHGRYLDAMALKSAVVPAFPLKLRGLLPKEANPDSWTPAEKRRVALLKEAVRRYTRQQFGKDAPSVAAGVGIHIDQPSHVSGMWRDIDQWIADHLGISVTTFRSWRRRLVEEGFLMPRGRISKARRRSGRDLITRLAQATAQATK
jgi:hypothetical protein